MDDSEKSQILCERASLPYTSSNPVENERQWCRKEKQSSKQACPSNGTKAFIHLSPESDVSLERSSLEQRDVQWETSCEC